MSFNLFVIIKQRILMTFLSIFFLSPPKTMSSYILGFHFGHFSIIEVSDKMDYLSAVFMALIMNN